MTAEIPVSSPMDDLALVEDGLFLFAAYRQTGRWQGAAADELLRGHGWTWRTEPAEVADAVDQAIERLRRFVEERGGE